MHKGILVAILLLSASGCDQIDGFGVIRISGDTDEEVRSSIDAMKKDMTTEEGAAFESALTKVVLSELDLGEMFTKSLAGEDLNVEAAGASAMAAVSGMSAEDVMAEAERLQKTRSKKQQIQIKAEIGELNAEIAELREEEQEARAFEKELEKLEISGTKLYWRKSDWSTSLVMELTVENKLDVAISAGTFEGTLITPGRSVPWLVDTFSYSIAGGLEPGEKQSWKLGPNQYGDWGNTPKDRDDTVFTVRAKNVKGPDGKDLFDISFSPEKLDRKLERLKTKKELLAKLAAD